MAARATARPFTTAATAALIACACCVLPPAAAQTTSPPAPERPAGAAAPTPAELAPRPSLPLTDPTALPPRPTPRRELGKPEEDLRLDVKAYALSDDAPPALRAALPALTARYVGAGRSFEDLSNAATEVTRYMQRELGYYLGYAYLPPQESNDGVIHIAILEGRLDRVVLNWSEGLPVQREVVQAYLDRLQPGSVLRVRDVERVVFLVNDLRGMNTRFEVQAGREPGTASLVVTPRPEAPYNARVDADLNGTRFLGRYRVSALGGWNSPSGRGDGVTANLLASTTGGLLFWLVNYTTPLGSDGIKFGAGLSGVTYQIGKSEVDNQDFHGSSSAANLFGLYPFVRSRNLNTFVVGTLDQKRFTDVELGVSRNKVIDSGSLGVNGDARDALLGGGVNTFEATVTAGRVKFPAGRPAALTDAPSFAKLGLGYTRLQDVVTGRLMLYVSLRAQWARDNLDTTEQFRLGGPDGLRAFTTGEGTGDHGALGTLELRLLPPEAWFGSVGREMVLALFYDQGMVIKRRHPPTDPEFVNRRALAGAGLGITWLRPGAWSARLSVASPTRGQAEGDTQQKNPAIFLQVTRFLL